MSFQSKPLPDLDLLRRTFEYNPHTGDIIRRSTGESCTVRHGKSGYLRVRLQDRELRAHRVAWALYNNEDPGDLVVDHINRVRHDNRITNLRVVTIAENNTNRDSKSLYRTTTESVSGDDGASVTIMMGGNETVLRLQPDSTVTVTGSLNGRRTTLTVSLA